jgi:hypothetical protein
LGEIKAFVSLAGTIILLPQAKIQKKLGQDLLETPVNT